MFPVISSNVIPHWLFLSLQDDLENMSLTRNSYPGDPLFWTVDYTNQATINMVQSYVKHQLRRYFPHHVRCVSVNVNGATANQPSGRFHVDFLGPDYGPDVKAISAVLYTSSDWNTQWGGETVIKTPDGTYSYSTYIPNNVVYFPSQWEHYGAAPNDSCPILRTSIGFTFQVCYNRPIATN